ncbi:hypothetical protein OSTOST_08534 [Ostertagia ostertagi]
MSNPFRSLPLALVLHQLLELEKPFAVIRPTPREDEDADKRSMIIDAIITRKLVFRNRPKPLITQQHLAQN